jgi:5-methylcytosine-specific restriction enzyme subunit McrC
LERLDGGFVVPRLEAADEICTVLGLARGHLVYAAGEAEPTTHVVNGPQDIQLVQHALDLNQPPQQLLGQISTLAAQLVART